MTPLIFPNCVEDTTIGNVLPMYSIQLIKVYTLVEYINNGCPGATIPWHHFFKVQMFLQIP